MWYDLHGYFTGTEREKGPFSKYAESLGFYDLVVFFEKSGIIYIESEGSNEATRTTQPAQVAHM